MSLKTIKERETPRYTTYKYISSKITVSPTDGGVMVALENLNPKANAFVKEEVYKRAKKILETNDEICIKVRILINKNDENDRIYSIENAIDLHQNAASRRLCATEI